MSDVVRFQTRARTVDHLGREQIADCPTAISELWKNSFDAYARTASLHIFDGNSTTAAIYDDGHGMSREEFVTKWLVLGTESKLTFKLPPIEDRLGLPYRKRQGKKGIGRLSVGFLARLLLVVTKRNSSDFVACLVDWRIFENPFLMLDDIELPIATFTQKEEIFELLPSLYDTLMANVWGNPEQPDRTRRITEGWLSFDKLEIDRNGGDSDIPTTRQKLEQAILEMPFQARHLEQWPLWKGISESGTALLMGDVIPDLESQLAENPKFAHEKTAKGALQSTLWSFSDPFSKSVEINPSAGTDHFDTSVIGWIGERRLSILEKSGGFPAELVETFEHIVDGQVDEDGCFTGRIKAFGNWLPGRVRIEPTEIQPRRADTKVGPFSVFIASNEIEPKNTTLSPEGHAAILRLLDSFSGLMVFRDGFRVMPYGRSDSDFFDVEQRRSINAGREFWNHRRMLGRIAISDLENPNLKDKAGREGIIDNRASKVFRQNVINILKTCARDYFGSSSEVRKKIKPELNEAYAAKKAEEERAKLAKRNRTTYRKALEANLPPFESVLDDLAKLQLESEQEDGEVAVLRCLERLGEVKHRRTELTVGRSPASLPPKVVALNAIYREKSREADAMITSIQAQLHSKLEAIAPSTPRKFLTDHLNRQASFLRRRLSKWSKSVSDQLDREKRIVDDFVSTRSKQLMERMGYLLEQVEHSRIDLSTALHLIDEETDDIDRENEETLAPIVSALESLTESINLELLASTSTDEVLTLQSELERINSLAQLGITVEIVSHELESYDSTMEHGLQNLPAEIKETLAYRQIKTGHEGLTARLRFLSPLKLSGEPERRMISGAEIYNYVRSFFANDLEARLFRLDCNDEFESFRIYDQPSRIFPVFLNLVNNARYWVMQSPISEHRVHFEAKGNEVIIADDGRGIPEEDLKSLFSLFFTRKQGGRGVGLYLCKANLAMSGHQISYIRDSKYKILPGANFSIKFRTS